MFQKTVSMIGFTHVYPKNTIPLINSIIWKSTWIYEIQLDSFLKEIGPFSPKKTSPNWTRGWDHPSGDLEVPPVVARCTGAMGLFAAPTEKRGYLFYGYTTLVGLQSLICAIVMIVYPKWGIPIDDSKGMIRNARRRMSGMAWIWVAVHKNDSKIWYHLLKRAGSGGWVFCCFIFFVEE